MITEKVICDIFNKQRAAYIKYGVRNMTGGYGVTQLDIELVADDLLGKVLRKERVFETKEHVQIYLFKSFKNNLRRMYGYKKIQNIPPLTSLERNNNYILARDIINNARKEKTSI